MKYAIVLYYVVDMIRSAFKLGSVPQVQVPFGADLPGHLGAPGLFGDLQHGASHGDPADLPRLAQPGPLGAKSAVFDGLRRLGSSSTASSDPSKLAVLKHAFSCILMHVHPFWFVFDIVFEAWKDVYGTTYPEFFLKCSDLFRSCQFHRCDTHGERLGNLTS